MAKSKMRYGIDLGTTNSAICKMENGEPVIKKTDTLKDTLPSCVSFTKKKIAKVGDSAYNDLRSDKSRATKKWANDRENVFIEFKRDMGTNKSSESSNMGTSYSPEELSAEVLKTLKSFIGDESVSSVVITVPAKFKADQIAATKRAAKLAGIEHCELLQEPIAASMAYGLSAANKNGQWLVFDFGGGTFDAALIKVEDGIMQVKDTEGDNYLGGKNLDYAIVDNIIIPYLHENYAIDEIMANEDTRNILRYAMKFYAEQTKNQLSFKPQVDITSQLDEFGEDDNGEEIELDLVITQEQLKQVLAPVFQKAVDITKDLLKRNGLKGSDLDKLILVGGPTYSPVLRQMLREQITPNVDTDIDPMTAVAKGAALFASGIDSEVKEEIAVGTVALTLSYEANSVQPMEFVTVQLAKDECTGSIPAQLFVELVRSDNGWSSGKVEINEIGDVIECQLLEGKNNAFNVVAYDDKGSVIPCFPKEINIMQGIVVGNAVLPYNISIEAHDLGLDKNVVKSVIGLEKNKQLPAVGTLNGLKTRNQLRPGIETDTLVIPIYQSEHNADGTSAVHNDHVFDVVITGDEVGGLIPVGSDVDITIKVDRSQMLTLEAFFPLTGETVEKEVEIDKRAVISAYEVEKLKDSANNKLRALKSTKSVSPVETAEAEKLMNDINGRFEGEKSAEDGRMHLQADIRRAFLKMEEVESNHEWDSLEAEIREEFDRLEKANNELGNKYDNQVAAVRSQVDMAIRSKDVRQGRAVLDDINSLFVAVTLIYQLIGFIDFHLRNFGSIQWKDANRARQLLQQGKEMANSNPSESTLHPIVRSVIDLMIEPPTEGPGVSF
ncbi:MAG: Hsp70 family protein [Duncaniella sp.]|nr:Hsp70 family protein [Duncaniella sp.]MCM1400941.1 Hsp70 family protein [Bacteroides sp.]MCM1476292.1 Hsp70 family protein [Bacteroides sp.]